MKVRNSLKSAKLRDKDCKIVRRKGRVYIINKKNPRMKARQGSSADFSQTKEKACFCGLFVFDLFQCVHDRQHICRQRNFESHDLMRCRVFKAHFIRMKRLAGKIHRSG